MAINFRGRQTCSCVVASLPKVEEYMLLTGLINSNIDIFQMGYNTGGVAASAGTHNGGGCVDVGQYSSAQIDVWRQFGWTMQHRTPAQGFSHHGHGWPFGCPHLSPGAEHQESQWRNGTNGLASYGRITGRYPIDNWKTALKRMEKKMADIEDRIAAEVTKRVVAALGSKIEDVPLKVWTVDGAIPNEGLTGNEKNPSVAAKTAVSAIFKEVQAARSDIASLKKV